MNNVVSSYRPRVKICGITRESDVEAVCEMGADAIGFVFYDKSPRALSPEQARALSRKVSPFVTRVGLFVDASEKQIQETIESAQLDLLQFHGNETEKQCVKFNMPYIKAIRMAPDLDVLKVIQKYPSASGFLLDTYKKGKPGGTGQVFDWNSIPSTLRGVSDPAIILAGGLNPDNVVEAVKMLRPYAVDLSGGVESEPGIKNKNLIYSLMNEIRNMNEVNNVS